MMNRYLFSLILALGISSAALAYNDLGASLTADSISWNENISLQNRKRPVLSLSDGDLLTRGNGILSILNSDGVLVYRRRVSGSCVKTSTRNLKHGIYIAHFKKTVIKFIR